MATKYKYTVTFESERDLLAEGSGKYDPIDIVESSMERGLVCADKDGVASWWYGSPSYAISWKILKQEVLK